jgi:signal peptide peptidase SppA
MRTSVAHLIAARPWALDRTSAAWQELVRLAQGVDVEIDLEAFEASSKVSAGSFRERMGSQRIGAVEVIPVFNVITQRYSWLTWLMDGTALDFLREAIREAVEDSDVTSIVLDVDSPGGSVAGLIEFADDLRKLAAVKPIVAVANPMSASAAVWSTSGATEFVCAPGGMVGSIGVYAMHVDMSRAMDEAGLTITYVHYGEYKVEGNPYEPLGEEAAKSLQAEVDYFGHKFEGDVAKGRKTQVSTVHESFGQGRMLLPEAAQAVGLIDRIDTLANIVKRYQRGAATSGRRAEELAPELVADIQDGVAAGPEAALEAQASGQQGDGPAADATETASGAAETATDDAASASAADEPTTDNPIAAEEPQPTAAEPTPLFQRRAAASRIAAGAAAFDRNVRGPDPSPWFERSQE